MLKRDRIRLDYKDWLVATASEMLEDYGSYGELLGYLHSREFHSTIQLDENRAADGELLRHEFTDTSYEYTYRDAYLYLNEPPCSVLEMMVALAKKCDDWVVWDPSGESHSGRIFYMMLESMRIENLHDGYFEERIAEDAVDTMLDRKYSRNGVGGLFNVAYTTRDFRELDIWYQMQLALAEEEGFGERK